MGRLIVAKEAEAAAVAAATAAAEAAAEARDGAAEAAKAKGEIQAAHACEVVPCGAVIDLTACSLYAFPAKDLSSAMPYVRELRLPHNKLTGSLLKFFQRLSPLRSLQLLDLRHNRLRGCFVAQARPILTALAILAPGVNLDGSINASLFG